MARKFFVGGNWKMNGSAAQVETLLSNLNSYSFDASKAEVVVSPVSIHLSHVRSKLNKEIGVAAQNCHSKSSGAYTGEISAEQLKDFGIDWVILGHSERRSLFHETSEIVAEKTKHALEVGVKVILCCGESEQEREAGKTEEVVFQQLKAVSNIVKDWSNIVVAYEPVWAIGTGKVATPQQAQDVHSEIRKWLKTEVSEKASNETRIIYGGSVNGANCESLSTQADIDGFLVGGASLKPEFKDIIASYTKSQ
ncbi:triosephosphate isomerase [Entomophthora muscae]|uniref:Triosephosphate isomerase n=1 Tax=Entomophthora muscae TaxID=34485 RepID=A0ACC2U9E8_9FUNG|nr:triosephosphate isomerase [Entomophthora muscae]